ncbi:hypothetical protein HBB16_10670 [Pseudonocardia sp. MCCB 268]|nr:hypothetical protein [Pseudonocardia cytotoxica]
MTPLARIIQHRRVSGSRRVGAGQWKHLRQALARAGLTIDDIGAVDSVCSHLFNLSNT